MKSVTIKGNRYGLIIHCDEDITLDEAAQEIINNIIAGDKFYNGATLCVTFEGKKFSDREEREIVQRIMDNTTVNIPCIIDNDKFREDYFRQSIDNRIHELEANSGQFYKGTLRSGQVLESESSVVILGDVNPGAKVIAAGNVVILGSLKGSVYAGVSGNPGAFVVALEMEPVQLRIGNIFGRGDDKPSKGKKTSVTKIAYVENDNIYIEPLNKEVLNDINLF